MPGGILCGRPGERRSCRWESERSSFWAPPSGAWLLNFKLRQNAPVSNAVLRLAASLLNLSAAGLEGILLSQAAAKVQDSWNVVLVDLQHAYYGWLHVSYPC